MNDDFIARAPTCARRSPTLALSRRVSEAIGRLSFWLASIGAAAIAMATAHAAQADDLATAAPASASSPPPAPLGVFGADMPAGGHVTLSFLPTFVRLSGNQIGVNDVSPQYIVTNVPWFNSATKLRLVPHSVAQDYQGASVAYGLTDNVTLVVATSYVEKSVDMETFKGASGATPLGYSVGNTEGIGDTAVATIVRVYQGPINQLHGSLGLSLPTGSTTENMTLLAPTGVLSAARAFYAMQPGSGTVDLLPCLTYSGALNAWSWGVSFRGRLPLDRGAQGWAYGDLYEATGWGGYTWTPGFETTLRLDGVTQGRIQGGDPLIVGKAEGANPSFYGGQRVDIFGGAIVSGRFIGLPSTQIAVEAGVPLYQNLNGPQIARDWQIALALRVKI